MPVIKDEAAPKFRLTKDPVSPASGSIIEEN